MAHIVLGIACAHELPLDIPTNELETGGRAGIDDGTPLWFRGERVEFDELLAERQSEEEPPEITSLDANLQRAKDALRQLRDEFARAEPDIAIIFGTDHDEMFHEDIKPAITFMGCDSFSIPNGSNFDTCPGHPVLASYLAKAAQKSDFDISYSRRQRVSGPNRSMSHAYSFVCSQLVGDAGTAIVPIDINTYYPPNQPQASRCFSLGRLVGKAVRGWDDDARIAVIASGGLSHPAIDEEFDRDIIKAMESGDFKYLQSYHEGHYQEGSSQIKTWLSMGGAIQGSYLKGHTVDYCPLYRTEAGTGDSAAFMIWQ